jgi:hypothetical protein
LDGIGWSVGVGVGVVVWVIQLTMCGVVRCGVVLLDVSVAVDVFDRDRCSDWLMYCAMVRMMVMGCTVWDGLLD